VEGRARRGGGELGARSLGRHAVCLSGARSGPRGPCLYPEPPG
jgi:hypothetical protein